MTHDCVLKAKHEASTLRHIAQISLVVDGAAGAVIMVILRPTFAERVVIAAMKAAMKPD
jgi:hypothetical protein